MGSQVLDTIDAARLGRELTRARKRKGMTQDQAAALIGVIRTTMVAIEKGQRRIKKGELIKLAEAYGRQVSDFVRLRPDTGALNMQFRGPWFRSEEDEEEIRPYIIEFEDLCRDYLELELLTDSPLIRKYPREYETTGMPVEATAETIAMEERNRLGLGDRPISLLRDLLEHQVGLRVFYLDLPSRYSEMYAFTDELGGCLAVNRLHPEERRRWSLAHGYFHFLGARYKAEVYVEDLYQRKPEGERFADAFAAYFLLPSSGLLTRFNDARQEGSVTPATLCIWANEYGVSVEAITRRLESMRLLPTKTWEKVSASIRIRVLQRELGLDQIPARDQKLPIRFTYLTIEAFRRDQIGEERLAQLLEVDRLEARRITEEAIENQQSGNEDDLRGDSHS